MICEIITHSCTKCSSINIVKNGKDYKNKQKFHCHCECRHSAFGAAQRERNLMACHCEPRFLGCGNLPEHCAPLLFREAAASQKAFLAATYVS